MIGVSIGSKREWASILKHLNIDRNKLIEYPYGEYIRTILYNKDVLLYLSNNRKVMSSGATQYMIDNFKLKKIIVIGTCAGINKQYKPLDILIPTKAVQYDATVKEIEPFLKDKFIVDLHTNADEEITIGTADKAIVMWNDFKELQNNKIDIADMESGAVAYVCKLNDVSCSIIKGISDFPLNKEKQEAYNEQFITFENNIPIIMKDIIDNYLECEINKK